MNTTIFTDGSSRGNPGPGGWGSVIVASDKSKVASEAHVIELGGGEAHTTNNRMEIMAAMKGLSHAGKNAEKIIVYTDSSYVINGITKWLAGWKRNGWMTKAKKDVLNKDLWMDLDEALQKAGRDHVSWKYVGGHVGILGNERCDHIATAFADDRAPKLYKGPLGAYDLPNILDISHDAEKMTAKKSSSSRSNAKAFSYVSSVGGVIEVHKTWAECEKRVKGAKGARYKKALDSAGEQALITEFESL